MERVRLYLLRTVRQLLIDPSTSRFAWLRPAKRLTHSAPARFTRDRVVLCHTIDKGRPGFALVGVRFMLSGVNGATHVLRQIGGEPHKSMDHVL